MSQLSFCNFPFDTMTLELIEAKDCKSRRLNQNPPIKNTSKGIRIIPKEDCSTSAKLKIEKMSPEKRAWMKKLGRI